MLQTLVLAQLMRTAPPPVDCKGILLLNTTSNGTNNHNDQISVERAVLVKVSGVNRMIAYQYVTYGGKRFIEFFTTFPALQPVHPLLSPLGVALFRFRGSVYGTLQGALKVTGVKQSTLPFPYKTMTASDPITFAPCTPTSK